MAQGLIFKIFFPVIKNHKSIAYHQNLGHIDNSINLASHFAMGKMKDSGYQDISSTHTSIIQR